MSSFSFTTGNPNNLTAGANASMADIQGPLTDLRTFLNGGTMDETNVPNLSAAFTTYKTVTMAGGGTSGASGTLLLPGPLGQALGVLAPGAAGSANFAFPLDPTDFAANTRTTKLRIRAMIAVNAVAPAVNFTFGLWAATSFGGGSGTAPTIASLGTAISGSPIAINAPAAAGATTATGTDFNFPAVGPHVLAVVLSGAMAANSSITVNVQLQARQV